MAAKSFYIAASGQHVGKSTITLGLFAALRHRGIDVGYSKLLGHKYVLVDGERVDKDAALLARAVGFRLESALHSPVILGPGDTARHLDGHQLPDLRHRILSAASALRQRHDMVLFEGAGHPGVGSVVDLSGAEIARMLGTGVILVLEGGIGSTIDHLTLCQSMFAAAGVPIRGVIANKVLGDKLEKVRRYLQQALARRGIEFLGAVPCDSGLRYPSMGHVTQVIEGEVVAGAAHLASPVRDVMASAWFDAAAPEPGAGLLLVTCTGRLPAVLAEARARPAAPDCDPPLAGIVVAGADESTPGDPEPRRQAECMGVPLVRTKLDIDRVLGRVGRLVAKLDDRSDHEIQRAIDLCEAHLDVSRICELMDVASPWLRNLPHRVERQSGALHERPGRSLRL